MRPPTFEDAVRGAPVLLRDGREGDLMYFPSQPRHDDQATVDINGEWVLVAVDDVIGVIQ